MIARQRRGALLRTSAFVGAIYFGFAGAANADDPTYQFNIPPESLSQALTDFSQASSQQIIYSEDLVRGRKTPGLNGRYTAEQALKTLVTGTDLKIEANSAGVLMVRSKNVEAASTKGAADPVNENASGIEEVVVTAKTGTLAIRSISGSETAFTGAQLEDVGAESLQDYLTRTPGVIFNAAVPGGSTATIRGVATTTGPDQGQSPTGYFISDVPLTDPYYSVGVPDIDTFDVSSVTILRGPQGTLFGSASLGGAINYHAAQPDLENFGAHLQGTGETSAHSSETAGALKGMVNIPIVEGELAVRGVYMHRQYAGFIDNVGTGHKDSNGTVVNGGRLEVTWTPTDSTKVSYLFLKQDERTPDVGFASPLTQGPYQKSTMIPEVADYNTEIHNLRIDQDLGFATLTATATYHKKKDNVGSDLSSYLSAFFGPGGAPYLDGGKSQSKGYTFETRLVSNPDDKLSYVIGAFYDHTRETLPENLTALNAAGFNGFVDAVYGTLFSWPTIAEDTAPGGVFFASTAKTDGKESAVFGEATYHFTDALKLTFGGRYFWTSLNFHSSASGLFSLLTTGSLASTSSGSQSESGFTPKVSLTWKPNENFMAYGLVSEGFRFGGPNVNPPDPHFATPKTFGSDSLVNYEAGIRTTWLDRKLQFDASVFYIDWSDIQLRLTTPAGFRYAANAGKASNYGAEISTVFAPIPGLLISNSVSYLSATLAQAFDPGGGQPIVPNGTTLPGASKWKISTAVSYTFANVWGTPTINASQRYISSAPGVFNQNVKQGGYSLFDLRATVHLSNGIEITPFVENIGDERGVTSASSTALGGYREFLVRPRTFGVTLDYRM